MKAFDEMIQMFSGIDLKLTNTEGACFRLDPRLPAGLNPQHQFSLPERTGACDVKRGATTANCFMIILDARKSANPAVLTSR
jgi:hypothetical protein